MSPSAGVRIAVAVLLAAAAAQEARAQARVLFVPAGFPAAPAVDLSAQPRARAFCGQQLQGLDLVRGALGIPMCDPRASAAPPGPGAGFDHLSLVLLVDDRSLSAELAEMLGPVARLTPGLDRRIVVPYQGVMRGRTQRPIRALIAGEALSAGLDPDAWTKRIQTVATGLCHGEPVARTPAALTAEVTDAEQGGPRGLVTLARQLDEEFGYPESTPECRGHLATALLQVHGKVEAHVRAHGMQGLDWDPGSPMAATVEDIPPFGNVDVWTAARQEGTIGFDVPGRRGRPANLRLAARAVNHTRIELTWTLSGASARGFEIERCEGEGCTAFTAFTKVNAGWTSFRDDSVSPETTYVYRVTAILDGATGPRSDPAAATAPAAPAERPRVPDPLPSIEAGIFEGLKPPGPSVEPRWDALAYFEIAEKYIKTFAHILNAREFPESSFEMMVDIERRCSGSDRVACVLRTVPRLPSFCYTSADDPRFHTSARGCRRAIARWFRIAQDSRRRLRDSKWEQERLRYSLNGEYCRRYQANGLPKCDRPW